MTDQPKLLIDECLSKPAIEAIKPLIELGGTLIQIEHQLDIYGKGADDTIWIPEAARDGWTVVTADRGSHSRLKAKLPLLCEAFEVTHILISSGLSQRRMVFKAEKFAAHIEEIALAAAGKKGCRYSLQLTGEQSTKLILLKSPTPEDIAKVQKRLDLKLPPTP